jgi:penicillin-binding protein 2
MLYEDNSGLIERIRYFRIGVILLIIFLAANFWYLQIIRGGTYRELALNNSIKLLEWDAARGVVEDRNGFVLVDNRPAYDISLVLEEVEELDRLIAFLCRHTGAEAQGIYDRLERCGHYPPFKPIVILEDVDIADVAFVESRRKDLRGLHVDVSSRRSYQSAETVGHVLGYVGEITDRQLKSGRYPEAQPGDIIGKAGLEHQYDRYLTGIKGWKKVEVTGFGRIKRNLENRPFIPGFRLRLSLDRYLQEAAESALGEFAGAVVVVDPRDGSILAMVSHPAFDPNLFSSRITREDWLRLTNDRGHPLQNRAVQSSYPPGSTFKIVMALAGLSEGVITPQTRFYCNGSQRIFNHVFRCWRGGGHGYVDLTEAITDSCNIYFYNVGKMLGRERIAEYAEKMGFGKTAGVDLPNEAVGVIPDDGYIQKTRGGTWYKGETISVSIGQGALTVTPLQLAMFSAALQNGGTLHQPRLLDSYITPDGDIFRTEPEVQGMLPVSSRHLALVRDAMEQVVLRGTGRRASVMELAICGKTGTAQVIRKKSRAPSDEVPLEERHHSVFISFCKDVPLAMAIIAEHGDEGGKTAAPMARQIYQAYLDRRTADDV